MIYEILRKYTCLEGIHLNRAIKSAPTSYKMYFKEKKNGGMRQIFHPSKETKLLQYAIIDLFLATLPVHDMATAYRPGLKSPLYRNAVIHAPYLYSLHIDFTDFFPSITPTDLFRVIAEQGIPLTPHDRIVINNVLFISFKGNTFLSIGAPASPIVSNIIMNKLDQVLNSEAKNVYDGVYSRYADDIWFSTNKRDGSNNFYQFTKSILKDMKSPRLRINEKKTLFCSKKKARLITGLTVTPNGGIVIPREKKRILRLLLNKRKFNVASENENKFINGYLSFVHDIEPDYYNSLILKYGDHVVCGKT